MEFKNINHLIACLRDIRDDHSLDLPIRFFIEGSSRIEFNTVTLKVVTTQNYNNGIRTEPKSELIISLS